MGIMSSEFQGRLNHWIRTLKEDFYHPLGPIAFEGYTTLDYLTHQEAAKGPFSPVQPGHTWGHTWEYMWLRANITMPEQARGKAVVMNLDLGGEAALFVNGQSFGTRRAEWVRVPHHYMVDNVLTQDAKPGEFYELLFEVYAGHYFPDAGGCATGPVLPGSFQDPLTEGRRACLGNSSFGIWNEDAYQLWLDVSTLQMLLEQIPESSLRASHIADALEKFTLMVDFEQDGDARIRDYRTAREMLRPVMSAANGSTAPKMYAVGNAHLDLAWLWPMQETFRKTERTFAQQLRLLERYPAYRYIQSQPAAYEMCREHYPELYARIKEAVKQGRWIAEGAMYVEPDTNMASGEALVRQLVYGKRFYQEEFGIDSRMLWLPDTFGYTAALPQILKGCHVDYLVTQKIFWSYNEGDRFPYHYFTWKGMDGSAVTSFLPTSYTYRTDPAELCQVWNNRVQQRHLDDFLIPFGYGDGGGGPCRDHIEYALRAKDLEGMPKVEMTSPLSLFEDLEQKGGPQDTWEGELYFSAHRGTYTSQAAIKRNNRLSELALREAEIWGALSGRYPAGDLNRLWKVLLLNQFHDILPGSSIQQVYTEANAAHEALQAEAGKLSAQAFRALTSGEEGITVFNALSFPRQEVIYLPQGFAQGAQTLEGQPVPVMAGKALVEVPAMGAVSLLPADAPSPSPFAEAALTAEGGAVLKNNRVTVVLNPLGEITSYLLATGRELAAGPMNRFLVFKDVPRLFDAWDIDSHYIDQPVDIGQTASLELVCAKGLTASLRLTRQMGDSRLSQIISLNAESARVDFDTTADWHALHRLLKVSFPAAVQAQEAFHEMQFGYVARPTHRSRAYDKDRFEVCNHRYTALADLSHGCAVLNDCKYGISVNGNAMELTLLRAAASPQMRADNGQHRFTYAFVGWEGSFMEAPVVQEGCKLNVPVAVVAGSLPAFSAFSLDRENILLDTVKLAEDGSGDFILRLYESKRADTPFGLSVNLPAKAAWRCDMLENKEEPLALENGTLSLHARPFQVLTIRIQR